ncbi:hypothetical protein FVE67_05095 [Thermosulfurimonas marina]|uniref:Uncharacterized protein n=1 Tax=Thermosulfurimonas marina TaxID=2047767 RepID=A0A6H1WST6_9BACT|nr:hypothetical protein [Thermosulfurimonas marina]QJA06214.1 hypothetical protein FVE67_05095 [Thermosulfurimonas marina]
MARLLTLKDWLLTFSAVQESDLRFVGNLCQKRELSPDLSRELRRRLLFRRKLSSFFRSASWHTLSEEELRWCEKKMEEILEKEKRLQELLDRLLALLEDPSNPL